MFKFLRSQAKIFYWVIAATFILFLFLGGLTGRGCQAPGTSSYEPGMIGSVNGVGISSEAYDNNVRSQTAAMRQQAGGNDLTSNQYAMARDRAWTTMVRSAVLEAEVDRHDIKVSDEEVLDAFQNNPPPEILSMYRTEEGQIDVERYFSDLANPEADWTLAERYVRESYLPQMKLIEEITADAVVGDDEVRTEYLRQTGRAVAEYMGAPMPNTSEDADPTDAEVQAWYDAHLDDYVEPTRGQCKVVRFAKEASDADWEEVRQYISEIREDIVSGSRTFEDAARDFGEDGTATQGGDLGTFDRTRMVAPFADAAFSLPVGELSEPVRTTFGYHLIEVLEQIEAPDANEVAQVHARHILIKVAPGPDTLDLIREGADDFRNRVDAGSFVTTAQAEAHDLLEPGPFAAGRDIPGLRQSLAGANWVLANEAGTVSRVLENNEFLYVILALEPAPEGHSPLAEVRGRVAMAVRQDRNLTAARAMLQPAVGEVQMGTSVAEAAAAHGLTYAVTDTFGVNDNIPDVGYGTVFNEKALAGEVGRIEPEIETPRGVFALVPLWILPVDDEDFAARKEGIRGALLQRAQTQVFEEWLQEQVDAAKVVDHRYAAGPGA